MKNSLNCSAATCVHNASGYCVASKIGVSGGNMASNVEQTECSTFKKLGDKKSFTSMLNTNIMGGMKEEFGSFSNSNDDLDISPKIKCDVVNCTYNDNKDCVAKKVQIGSLEAENPMETKCETFTKRQM